MAISGQIRFENIFPKVGKSKLFSNRHELSYILRDKGRDVLVPKILKLFPKCKQGKEIIATTYFEPVLIFQPEKTCVVRFRQRLKINEDVTEFPPPKIWKLEGSGNLEIKVREIANKKKVFKTGAFLPMEPGRNIYSILGIAKLRDKPEKEIFDFIERANKAQLAASSNKNLQLIDSEILARVAPSLSPHATRVNIRDTFEIDEPESVRITIETYPTFYAYPIEHRVREKAPFNPKYKGYSMESPNRSKIEIKTADKTVGKRIEAELQPQLDDLKIPGNKYTRIPYYRMIFEVSEKAGTLVTEQPTREIEAKANIVNQEVLLELISKIRNALLKRSNPPYQLFLTEPEIGMRGDAEQGRTIFGWKDNKGKWVETATIIRMTQKGAVQYGFSSIIKWKTDYKKNTGNVLDRKQMHKYYKHKISDSQLLEDLSQRSGKPVEIVGVAKKMKYRIYVQDEDGRNFVVSLDECNMENPNRTLQQLEVEYAHTVVVGKEKKLSTLVEKSCDDCMTYFMEMLDELGVQAERTKMRKIDFVGGQ